MKKNHQSSELQVAIFGAGGIARKAFLPLISTWPGIKITGVFSRTQESVDTVCSEFRLKYGTTDAQQLIGKKPDAAFVLTNNQTHFKFTEMLLKAGIDVLVEKPPAQHSQEIQNLARIAEQNKRILMVGFNRRYSLFYKQARDLFINKKIQLAIFQKHRPRPTHTSLYNNYLDDTIHQIDLMRFICGEVEPIKTTYEQENGKLVGAASLCQLKEGGLGLILTSLQAGSWQEKAILHGENLTVEVDAFEKLTIKKGDHEQVFGTDRPGKWIPDLQERGFRGEIADFFQCVMSRKQPQASGAEAVKTHLLIEKLVEAAGLNPAAEPGEDWDDFSRWE